MVEYETPLQPPVLGGAELRRFTGDRGGNCTEIVLGGQCLLDNEEHVPEWAMVALASLLNAVNKTVYDFDQEVIKNGGFYPVNLSAGLASDIDTLLRLAYNYTVARGE